jgi:4-diphosphocytidyl-2-C-methyl-D-erythritol kinase
MSAEPRRARVKALAKINLGLKVLYRRPDGYHELRTVFQTVSLADVLDLEFRPGRGRRIEAYPEIPNNLVIQAAEAVFDAASIHGEFRARITKRIPMGSGLGGGSSNAAAVLLALPALAGKPLALERLIDLASRLGSDVPFFLWGGAAAACGRGTELYPLPDAPPLHGVIVAPGIHVATPEAYRKLARPGWAEAAGSLTETPNFNYINKFQAFVWGAQGQPAARWDLSVFENDFESVVFDLHPRLKQIKRTLERLGALCASMSGSGSALYALFENRQQAEAVWRGWKAEPAFRVRTVSRAEYRRLWRRSLAWLVDGKLWPPDGGARKI